MHNKTPHNCGALLCPAACAGIGVMLVHQSAFYAGTGRNGVYNGTVIGMGILIEPVGCIDMKCPGIEPHVQVAAIKAKRGCFKVGFVASFPEV